MKPGLRIASFIAVSVLLLTGCATTTSLPSAANDPTKAQVTIIYDAFGRASEMEKDWGFAALIEYGGMRILFDTGDNPDILAKNAKAKAVDLSSLDFVVMSHRVVDRVVGKMRMAHSSGWEPPTRSPWRATTGGTRRGQPYQEDESGA